MKALQEEYGDRGFRLVAINSNDAENYPADLFDAMMPAQEQEFNSDYLRRRPVGRAGVRAGAHARGLPLRPQPPARLPRCDRRQPRGRRGVTERYVRDAIEALLADQDPPVSDAARGLFGQVGEPFVESLTTFDDRLKPARLRGAAQACGAIPLEGRCARRNGRSPLRRGPPVGASEQRVLAQAHPASSPAVSVVASYASV